jgi:hypothetical protein
MRREICGKQSWEYRQLKTRKHDNTFIASSDLQVVLDLERFHLESLNEEEIKEQHQFTI